MVNGWLIQYPPAKAGGNVDVPLALAKKQLIV